MWRALVAYDATTSATVMFPEEKVELALADMAGRHFRVVLPFRQDYAAGAIGHVTMQLIRKVVV